MGPQNETIDRLVVNEGSVLGVGGHKVALPVDQLGPQFRCPAASPQGRYIGC